MIPPLIDPKSGWQEQALCRNHPTPDLWFPEPAGGIAHGSKVPSSALLARINEARTACLACPVRKDCLCYALERPELEGIWGGTTARDRRRMNGRAYSLLDLRRYWRGDRDETAKSAHAAYNKARTDRRKTNTQNRTQKAS